MVDILDRTPALLADDVSVPIYSDISEVYGDEEVGTAAKKRYHTLYDEFQKTYGQEPSLFARAPGRVNLIGEHVDYEGYSVLPMAIQPDTIVAIRLNAIPTSDSRRAELRIANIRPQKYKSCTFAADPKQEVDTRGFSWANYFLCGYKGVYEHMASQGIEAASFPGFDVLVDGVVPAGAGLSSSAALVCSSAIAIMAALGLRFPQREVAEFTCACERHIGTQSGGMDQAISVMAKPGVAQRIDFHPINATDVRLPEGGTFVIANSLTESNKAETASIYYNNRVVECRLAAMVLAAEHKMPLERVHREVHTLRDVELLLESSSSFVGGPKDKVISAVLHTLHDEPYTRQEIEGLLGGSLSDVFADSPTSLDVLKAATEFKLRQRARHVYGEANRVGAFQEAAASADTGTPAAEVLGALGALMDESHSSCSHFYECSCPELEELVGLCRKVGALGSRLTGAGWGGCTVSLVREGDVPAFMEALKEGFYKSRIERGLVEEGGLSACLFASKPSGGAAIFRL